MAEERKHALLSASSAKRWINCPPSARLSEAFPESTSDYAEEGTLAHDICELKLRKLFIEPGMPEKTFKTAHNQLKEHGQYDPEMERYTDEYVDYIQKIAYSYPVPPKIVIEKEVHYGHVARDGYGFSDCIILSGTDCHVVDFKYGKGITVSAEENPQMMLYAVGAIAEYGIVFPVERVILHIVQPRTKNFSRWELSASQLQTWSEQTVKPAAELAWEGKGDFRQGSWCDDCFCPAAGTCRFRMEENMAALQKHTDPITGKMIPAELLTNGEIGSILPFLEFAAPWIKKVRAAALDKLLADEDVPGWKLVEGRSNRELPDPDKAYAALVEAGYKKALFYERIPVTLTEAEKLINKDAFNTILMPFIVKPKGKPTLAPKGDKRPPYQKDTTPQEDFGGENQYKEEEKTC